MRGIDLLIFIVARLEFSENTVHGPVYGGCRDTCAAANADALQMFYYILDKWKLYERWVGHFYNFIAFTSVKFDRSIVEDGEAHGTTVADNLNTVLAGRVVGNETPGT